MTNQGWIKLYRKLLDSDMYKNLNSKQKVVMITCLLLANHEENEWEYDGEIYTVKPGQFITSLEKLRQKCGKDISVQNVRTALLKLEKWGFLTNESTKTGRLITIVNWKLYQGNNDETNKEANKELTKHQQRANKELTTNKNDNNDKNDKEINNSICNASETANDIDDVINFYIEHFQDHNLVHLETIESYMDEMQPALVKHAMELAIQRDKRFFRYVRGILESWLSKGIKTLEDYEREELGRNKPCVQPQEDCEGGPYVPNVEETRKLMEKIWGRFKYEDAAT